jgi:hypothetical protein
MAWFAVDPDLKEHVKFLRLRRAGSFTEEVAILALFNLWSLTRRKHLGGVIKGHDQATLSDLIGIPGAVKALLEARFLSLHDDGFVVVGWMDLNGKFLKDNNKRKEPAGNPAEPAGNPPPTVTDTKTDTDTKKKTYTSCVAPSRKDAPLVELPTNRGDDFPIYRETVTELGRLYPAVDVEQALRSMRAWLLSNPSNRKTYRGMMKFVNGWLSREQNRAPRMATAGPEGDERAQSLAKIRAYREKLEAEGGAI